MSRSSNILRNTQVEVEGKAGLSLFSEGDFIKIADNLRKEKDDIERQIREAEDRYKEIIQRCEDERKNILEEAEYEAKSIEKKAYEIGYEQGLKNGYEDGYKESYEQNIEKALSESEKIKNDGYTTLLNIKDKASDYIKENKNQIIDLSIAIAEQVLREKFENKDSMNMIIENAIREYSLKKDLIIKVNPLYLEEVESNISNIFEKSGLEQKIFVIGDSNIDKGNAEIESGSGKLIIGLDSVLERVREELA